jgi:hypothetical protein
LPWFKQPVVWYHHPKPDHILRTRTRYSVADTLPLSATDEELAASCYRGASEMALYSDMTLCAQMTGTNLDENDSVNAPVISKDEID